MRCQSCEVANINGIRCHEHGCPDAWRDELRECKECGREFVPEDRHQQFCDVSCLSAYSGISYGVCEDVSDEEMDMRERER